VYLVFTTQIFSCAPVYFFSVYICVLGIPDSFLTPLELRSWKKFQRFRSCTAGTLSILWADRALRFDQVRLSYISYRFQLLAITLRSLTTDNQYRVQDVNYRSNYVEFDF
ncbi:hypothetical protein U1Q18_005334, partial [Sarracenia purpurea var. burkii]